MWKLAEYLWITIILVNFVLIGIMVTRRGKELVRRIRAGSNEGIVFLLEVVRVCVLALLAIFTGPIFTLAVWMVYPNKRDRV